MHFFLGSENDEPESDDEEDGIRAARKDVRKMEHSMGVGKSGRKQEKQLKQLQKEASKVSLPVRWRGISLTIETQSESRWSWSYSQFPSFGIAP